MAPLMIAVENRMQELFAYAGASERTPRDRWIGFAAAILVHAVLLLAAGHALYRPAQYGVESGGSSLEITLVAAPAAVEGSDPSGTETEVFEAIEEPVSMDLVAVVEPVIKRDVTPSLPAAPVGSDSVLGDGSSEVPGKDLTTLVSEGGALTQTASPSYRRNPPPAYPEAARRRGEEGLVVLLVQVDRSGRAADVTVHKDSGFSALDEAALRSVKRWRFEPARIGALAVDSRVEVPIRFQLEK